jgi:hypothetical protein
VRLGLTFYSLFRKISMPKRRSEFGSVKRAVKKHKQGSWLIEGTSHEEISRNLDFDSTKKVRDLLKENPKKVVYLELGCGESPETVRRLVEEFGPQISSGRLEVHASHLMPKAEEEEFRLRNISVVDGGANIHNATIPMLSKKGIKADVIQEHSGPTTHSSHPVETAKQVRNSLLKDGGVFAFHIPKDQIGEGDERELRALGASKKHDFELADRMQRAYHMRK